MTYLNKKIVKIWRFLNEFSYKSFNTGNNAILI